MPASGEKSDFANIESVLYTKPFTIRLDEDSVSKLKDIGLFERKKRAVLARDILVEKMRVYDRNPAFKRFQKQLAEQRSSRRKPRVGDEP